MMYSYEERTRELDYLRDRARILCGAHNTCVGCILSVLVKRRKACTRWKKYLADEVIEVAHCAKRFPVAVEHGRP